MSTGLAILGTISAVLGLGIIISSSLLLYQALSLRDFIFYGGYYNGGLFGGLDPGGGLGLGLGAGLGGGQLNNPYYNNQGLLNNNPLINPYGNLNYGNNNFYSPFNTNINMLRSQLALSNYGNSLYGPDWRYTRVMVLCGAGILGGITQFLVSFFICCANGRQSIAVVVGLLFPFIALSVCLGYAIYFRALYPFYMYLPIYSTYNTSYWQYNTEGILFISLTSVNLVYILVASIVSCAVGEEVKEIAKRFPDEMEEENYHFQQDYQEVPSRGTMRKRSPSPIKSPKGKRKPRKYNYKESQF